MSVTEFVKGKYGSAAAVYLAHIRRGGDSNQKGTAYEAFYAAAKIFELAANPSNELHDFSISSQDIAFVDDLCVRQISIRAKTNYQAKNSSGAPANWDAEMEERFRRQLEIDTEFHEVNISTQVLLVSCPIKARDNESKIPSDLKERCYSEYFPYQDTSTTRLLCDFQPLRSNLEALCGSSDLSLLDSAFKLVLAIWGTDADRPRMVDDILGRAKALGKPNIFVDTVIERTEVPSWLLEKCYTFNNVTVRVESASFIVSYNGLEVGLACNVVTPDSDEIGTLSTPMQFLNFLMRKNAAEALIGTEK
ncbi:hypothetical protein [Iodobacter fluviatilis]|uniref:Uncharacterized protein n=1 Tax=Iodobacter fluviatilis TaxID=537 RepID=A0A7G3G9J2_9NEIS|nr:hypothetical protein [Iodobacter fluviatilis]QBC43834.1 hypothetical protein C1H71_09925 [Iodobacter fluviatilis]